MPDVNFVLAHGQNSFFSELAEALSFELNALGVRSSVRHGGLEPSPGDEIPVLLPPHEYARLCPQPLESRMLGRAICICAEQPDSPWFGMNLPLVRAAGATFDLNASGAQALGSLGVDARHLPLGYTSAWDRFDPAGPRPVDICFLGCSTLRRERLLASFATSFSQRRADLMISDNRQPNAATSPSFLAGEAKRELLARAKLLLNLHRDSEPYFEWLRALEAIHCGTVVVSEWSVGHAPLAPGEHFVSARPQVLDQVAAALLEDEGRRLAIQRSAYELLRSELPMRGSAEKLAEAAEALAARPPTAGACRLRRNRSLSRRPADGFTSRLVPMLEHGSLPVERVGKQVRDIRLELAEVRRQLDRLTLTIEAGEAPPVADLDCETAAWRVGEAPEVSVIVSMFNYGQVVREALDSVIASSFESLELVIVDDASSDDSASVVRDWMAENDAVAAALLRHPVNRGLPATRNTAVEHARGRYVLVLDADNIVYPHCIERLHAGLEGDSGAAFAYGILERFDESGPIGLMGHYGWDPSRLRTGNYIDALALIRRDFLEQVGGYTTDIRLFGWEDYDLWCTVASRGMHAVHVREIVGRYRVAAGSMTSLNDLGQNAMRSLIAQRHPAVFDGSTPPSATIEWIAGLIR